MDQSCNPTITDDPSEIIDVRVPFPLDTAGDRGRRGEACRPFCPQVDTFVIVVFEYPLWYVWGNSR